MLRTNVTKETTDTKERRLFDAAFSGRHQGRQSVYIDPLMTCLVSSAWRWPKSCHMFVAPGTDLEVLHAFAKRIGLRREWFQDKKVPHYDLNPSRRDKAVAAGVIELDRRGAVGIYRQWTGREYGGAA